MRNADHQSRGELSTPRADEDLESRIKRKNQILSRIRSVYDSEVSSVARDLIEHEIVRCGREDVTSGLMRGIHEMAEGRGLLRSAVTDLHISPQSMRALFSDIVRVSAGLTGGRPLSFVATTCPDYPYDPETRQYLTVGGLGSSAGLCGELTLDMVMPTLRALSQMKVPVHLVFAYADIEANDPVLVRKSKLSRSDFLECVNSSATEMEQRANDRIKTEALSGVSASSSLMSSLLERPVSVNEISPRDIAGVASHRRGFYTRFFGDQIADSEAMEGFALDRARQDILDHRLLGEALSVRRRCGEPVSLLTLSIPVLTHYFNYGSSVHVPVLRIGSTY